MPDHFAAPFRIHSADAPYYLGMDREQFDAQARPFLNEIPDCDGRGSTSFYRKDLDAWADDYKREQGRRR